MAGDPCVLWCGNISERVDSDLLHELFSQAGPVANVSLSKDRDGRQRTYSFVHFEHEESVAYALELLKGTRLFDRTLSLQARHLRDAGTVGPMRPQPDRRTHRFDPYNKESGKKDSDYNHRRNDDRNDYNERVDYNDRNDYNNRSDYNSRFEYNDRSTHNNRSEYNDRKDYKDRYDYHDRNDHKERIDDRRSHRDNDNYSERLRRQNVLRY